ncbi:high-affinity nickel-transport protein-domain-containing protein [Vararia minispora EC-137]|uniref:High-affinity nickel-transport protein-domain-containing protein n=1 Tax=Vararia minispora EC-137 TaxID=1314806 RepID=A0ACB8QGZ7_9AGAM|nr:high-affinity nickel-transport protein-domain-containing protein [Vararia minispora EC-137]
MHRVRLPRLTLLGRATLLLTSELIANATCWAVAAVLFARDPATRPILSLALLAWTIGLRHALDADHISAIDNATRGLLSLGHMPVTCGLFFSLGHSTVVIAVNIAIAISTDVANRLDGVGSVGGIIGASVSASFLFIVGLANSIILYRTLRARRRGNHGEAELERTNTLMMKILGPVVRFVNASWKMYPVGLLFGFDTASSIALLAAAAIAKRDANGNPVPSANIVILPLLFTAAMTFVDSVDSVLMLYSYAGFPKDGWRLIEPTDKEMVRPHDHTPLGMNEEEVHGKSKEKVPDADVKDMSAPERFGEMDGTDVLAFANEPDSVRVKRHLMSNLSVILTAMSIVVAFSISLITIMGLIGSNCARCSRAAGAEGGGGLEGSWWRFWAAANNNSGYIGAGIVGSFVVVVGAWYGIRQLGSWRRGRSVGKV